MKNCCFSNNENKCFKIEGELTINTIDNIHKDFIKYYTLTDSLDAFDLIKVAEIEIAGIQLLTAIALLMKQTNKDFKILNIPQKIKDFATKKGVDLSII